MNENTALDDDQIRALEILHEITSQAEDTYATGHDFEERQPDWTAMDVQDLLGDLCDSGYAEPSGTLAGGWRCTRRGRQVMRSVRESRIKGPERQERVLQWMLHAVIDHRAANRDDCEVHEEGWPPVTSAERAWALRGLEKLKAARLATAMGGEIVRVDPTPQASDLLVECDRSLLERLRATEGVPTVHNDNRVGLQAHEFHNNGAVSTGDHATMNVTITHAERQQITAAAARARADLQDAPADSDAMAPVLTAVDRIEEEAKRPEATRGTLAAIGRELRTAWTGAVGGAMGDASVGGAAATVTGLLQLIGA